MIKIPMKMPKNCRECPFFTPDIVFQGKFYCDLILRLQCYGGYTERSFKKVMFANYKIKNKLKKLKDCLLKGG